MPCRMLVAAGEFPVAQLLDDFKLVALNRNEKHELNRNNPDFIHDSGWGIVLGRSGRLAELYKKDMPPWQDLQYEAYRDTAFDFVMLHARRASPGSPVDLGHTHPFERCGSYFCHNGTITRPRFDDQRDSESFFHLILDHFKQGETPEVAIRRAASQMQDYTAINLILTHNDNAYIFVDHRESPDYYTMKYLEHPHYAIVSSETLPTFSGHWTRISRGTLLTLDTQTHQIRASKAPG